MAFSFRSLMKTKIRLIREYAAKLAKQKGIALHGSCVLHAFAGNRLFGYPIVAGSASWKFTSFDDGSNPTHFSYVFEPHLLASYMAQNRLPEIHVWNTVDRRVLDLTTGFLPEQAKALAGFQWEKALTPKPIYFGQQVSTDRSIIYEAHPVATQYVKWLLVSNPLDRP